jgi:hypothetical protein
VNILDSLPAAIASNGSCLRTVSQARTRVFYCQVRSGHDDLPVAVADQAIVVHFLNHLDVKPEVRRHANLTGLSDHL